MPLWLRALLAALAVYRMAQMITIDHGPLMIFDRIRAIGGAYDRGPKGVPLSELGRLLACPYCVGIWLALGAAAMIIWPTTIGDALLLWLGIAGAAAYWQGPRKP